MRTERRLHQRRGPATRVRSGLRRHGVVPRPAPLRKLLRAADVEFTFGNEIELYSDGGSGLAAMLEAIRSARRRVHLESYILRSDVTGRRFLEALTRLARDGVAVRVLYDGIGSRDLDPAALAPLRAAGGDAVVFNPLGRLWPRWAPRQRDHRKILVVDGEVAFTGGLNIGDEYHDGVGYGGEPPAPWRDAHVRVEGPAVAMLEAVFLESWFRADAPDRPWLDLAATAPEEREGEAVAVLADGPTYHTRRMRELMIDALARTRERAVLVTPYFVPGAKLRAAIGNAVGRGVRVELLTAGQSDHPAVRWAAHGVLPDLVARGMRVYEYDRAMLHAKVAVFDGGWAVLGTSNLDRQSLQHSYEVNLIVEGGRLPGALLRTVEADIERSRPLTAADLAARSPWVWLRDHLAAMLLSRF